MAIRTPVGDRESIFRLLPKLRDEKPQSIASPIHFVRVAPIKRKLDAETSSA
ncbi:hypothetical protein [Flavobacterium sp.]|uniref:hypothetical protein n=1 Tax=Flavobacterium sp. TaxID=239 RepID=UPI0037BEF05E